MNSAAFISCLAWTRDRLPVSALAAEGDLLPQPREAGSRDDRWRLDFNGGHLIAVQHNDKTWACTIIVFGVSPDMVVENVEHNLVRDGLPSFLHFDRVDTKGSDIVDRLYRQSADKKISAVLTTDPSASGEGEPSALLTFFHEGK